MQVFISHDSSDASLAHKLAKDLQRIKIKTWITPDSIRAGESWVESLNRGLEESSHIVVLLTPGAVASAWVRHEVDAGIVRERNKQTQLIPLEVEHCDVPALWNNYQRISFQRYEQGFRELQKALINNKLATKIHKAGRSEKTKAPKVNKSQRELTEIDTYAQLYDALYPKLPSDLRNYVLNSVIVDQVYLLGSSTNFQAEVLRKMFNRGTAGYRIMVLLVLQTNPTADACSLALETIANPFSPFEQYHGLRSAALMTHLLSVQQVKQLLNVLKVARNEYLIPVNRGRWDEYQHILQAIDNLRSNKRKKTKLSRK